mgnify:CR=1 FL=1
MVVTSSISKLMMSANNAKTSVRVIGHPSLHPQAREFHFKKVSFPSSPAFAPKSENKRLRKRKHDHLPKQTAPQPYSCKYSISYLVYKNKRSKSRSPRLRVAAGGFCFFME